MDAYLSIAEDVLRAARKPLGPREILKRAYAADIVPLHLHGRTQHKTLQARISEDILIRKERSAFFRTQPGKFFLSEFIPDESIPARFRIPIVARRRTRELAYLNALAFDQDEIDSVLDGEGELTSDTLVQMLHRGTYHYATSNSERAKNDVVVWSYVLVLKGPLVLTYRHGRFREDREEFVRRRSIGFFAPVVQNDLTLFGQHDHGIVESGLRALLIDLDIASELVWGRLARAASMRTALLSKSDCTSDLLVITDFRCPDWFEPLTRRLAINDLRWHNLDAKINHLEDFDPWSRIVLSHLGARRSEMRLDGAGA